MREHVDYEIALEKRLLQRQEELSRLAGELAGRLALSRTIESAVMARLEAHGRGEPSMDWDMECALWMAAPGMRSGVYTHPASGGGAQGAALPPDRRGALLENKTGGRAGSHAGIRPF